MNLRAPAMALLLIPLLVPAAFGIFLEPDRVPVDRLIATATRYLRLHPQEAGAHYTLARIHYLAFSQGDRLLESHGVNDQGQVFVGADDPGEIATLPTGTDGIHLKHPRGITFTDGHSVPSWDWVVEPRQPTEMSLASTHAALHP